MNRIRIGDEAASSFVGVFVAIIPTVARVGCPLDYRIQRVGLEVLEDAAILDDGVCVDMMLSVLDMQSRL